MKRTFRFRFRKGTWGLWVDLTAETLPLSAVSAAVIGISRQVRLHLALPYVAEENLQFLMLGLKIVQAEIERHRKAQEPVVISIAEIGLIATDYQPEALACAIIGWAAEEFGFTPPEIPITFDKEQNRYIVEFPSQ